MSTPTAEQVLAIARREIGVTEFPPDSNKVKYNTWYYGREVFGAAYPWCGVFAQWCYCGGGSSDTSDLLPARTASCGELMRTAKKAGQWVTEDYQPGDLAVYDFGGDGVADHCGIVEQTAKSGILAIEGNTSIQGSQSNGGAVCRKHRPYRQVLGAVRPKFKEETKMDNTPSPAHKEGVAWAVEQGILAGNAGGDLMLHQAVTREQFCTMTKRTADWLMGRFTKQA